ncbi:DUF4190 domain-containing protein [Herbiconiux sp. 11R-BC]|uniref:DUF4190 domain-containing protein n=1 Tax=Herbiconiux sp. 11R-BC TaxID=3111637 RepID=UPI003C0717BC
MTGTTNTENITDTEAGAPTQNGQEAHGAQSLPFVAYPVGFTTHYTYQRKAPTNALAIVSLVAAILGLVLVPVVGSIVAVITGHMSLDELTASREEGRGQALAGTVIGYLGLLFAVPAVISFFLFLPVIASHLPGM